MKKIKLNVLNSKTKFKFKMKCSAGHNFICNFTFPDYKSMLWKHLCLPKYFKNFYKSKYLKDHFAPCDVVLTWIRGRESIKFTRLTRQSRSGQESGCWKKYLEVVIGWVRIWLQFDTCSTKSLMGTISLIKHICKENF